MSDPVQTLFRGDSWNFPGLKEGQILRTISNMTYSDSHYTSDEDKLGEALRRGDFQDAPILAVERLDSLTPRLEMPLSLEAAACTLSMAGTGTLENPCKAQQAYRPAAICEAIKQSCAENSHAVFDMVVNAGGPLPARDIQQNFCLRSECSGAFADALNSIDFSAGGTLSPKLLQQQLGNLSHLFDDLDKASSDMSECPDTPLQLFPVTPTSDLLMQNHFNQCLPEAPTPPLTTPSRKLPYGRYGSQQMSLESLQNSPGSSLMGNSCSLRGAHSMPLPMHAQPSPQGPRLAPPVQMGERAMSLTLPPMLEPQMYLPPIRTTLKASDSPKPSPSRPSGIRKVQAGKPKVRRALKSEDSLSVSATDSEADSLLADSGAAKRKPGAKKGSTRRTRRMTCRNCGAHQTPQWRCGPEGPRTLCNACGVRYKKGLPLICTVPKGSLPPLPSAQEPTLPADPAAPMPMPVDSHLSADATAEGSSVTVPMAMHVECPAGPMLPSPAPAVPMAMAMAIEASPVVL